MLYYLDYKYGNIHLHFNLVYFVFLICLTFDLFFVDPSLIEMVNRSMEGDGDFPSYLSQGSVRSQSPVRYSSQMFGISSLSEFGYGSFVVSTPERESKRFISF